MAKKNSARKSRSTPRRRTGADLCREICASAQDERRQFGLEEMYDIAKQTLSLLVETTAEEAPRLLYERFLAVGTLAWETGAISTAFELASKFACPIKASLLFWMCLDRINELSDDQRMKDLCNAWRDSWGDDHKAAKAKALFASLAPIKRARKAWTPYLHDAMLVALETAAP